MGKGDIVKMSWTLRFKLLFRGNFRHLFEFGFRKGIVEDFVNYNNENENLKAKIGPEINIRWLPSKLRYCYLPEELVKLTNG